ncbi:uncharacterized protein M6B38_199380 [Iris pallida]|uniref:Uncharacterized protein n=1 Tax=Iris pallida TaxID=29817 RepID=A0AAX6EAF1_IRIPA|nr:uncharacterized protein M6B38_199380 [Iris pallida]
MIDEGITHTATSFWTFSIGCAFPVSSTELNSSSSVSSSEVVASAAQAMKKVDVHRFRKPFLLLQWMGMNALIVFILAASELFPVAVQGFYWCSPSNNLVNATESLLHTICRSEKLGTMAFVLLEILFWCRFYSGVSLRDISIEKVIKD